MKLDWEEEKRLSRLESLEESRQYGFLLVLIVFGGYFLLRWLGVIQ